VGLYIPAEFSGSHFYTFAQNLKNMKKHLPLLVLITLLTFKLKSQCTFGSFPPSYTLNAGWTNGAWLAQTYSLASTATLTGFGLNSAAGSGVAFRMAMYTDASGTPGTLVSASNQSTMALGPNIQSIPAYTVIPAGNYWLVAIYNGPGPTTYSNGGTPIMFQAGALSTPPANSSTWTIGSSYLIDYWAVINSPTVSISGSTLACIGTTVTLTASGAVSSYTWSNGAISNTISVSPNTNTIYTVAGIGTNGCPGSSTQSLTSHVSPILNITGNNNVCVGSSLTQTVSGATSYTWSNGANTNTLLLSPVTNTVYTVTGSDAAGCTGSASVGLTVNPLPILAITGTHTLCIGSSLTQTVSGATSYTWSNGANTNTLLLSPLSNTVYTVTGSSIAGCTGSASVALTVNPLPTLAITGTHALCIGSSLTQTVSGATSYTWSNGANTSTLLLSPVSNTVYTVTGSDAVGCTGSASVALTVNPLPTLAITGAHTLCIGFTLTQTVTGANNYVWNTGATTNTISLVPLSSTLTVVSGTNANGCVGSSSTAVVVSPLPVLAITSSNTLICAGEEASLTVSGVTSNTWNTGANAITLTATPTITTVYKTIGTSSLGCVNSATFSQVVDLCTSVAKNQVDKIKISFAPNPSHGVFEVRLNSLTGNTTLEIYSFEGRFLAGRTLLDETTTVDLSSYSNGLYYVIVRSQNNQSVTKLIKE